MDDGEDPAEPDENKNEKDSTVINPAIGNVCNDYDLEAVEEWYTVYDLTFIRSIKDAWTGDAKLLAFIIVIFSGIWPYLKVRWNYARDQYHSKLTTPSESSLPLPIFKRT